MPSIAACADGSSANAPFGPLNVVHEDAHLLVLDKPADLLADFSWEPLRANHLDRALKPDDPTTPQWLAEALG